MRRILPSLVLAAALVVQPALAQERGLPGEAKLVIEEGRAANMLPKTNLSVNEIYTAASGRIAADKASLPASLAS